MSKWNHAIVEKKVINLDHVVLSMSCAHGTIAKRMG
jgi:hypothetical protein